MVGATKGFERVGVSGTLGVSVTGSGTPIRTPTRKCRRSKLGYAVDSLLGEFQLWSTLEQPVDTLLGDF